jgi:hypothetical protein
MRRRTIVASASFFTVCLIPGAVLFLSLRPNSSSHHFLRGGEVVDIDFGFPTAPGYDFDARSEVTLTNNGEKPIRIESVQKSCACQRLILEPNDVIPPGQDLRIRFAHASTTNGTGGYFSDRILLRISDGQNPGDVSLRYGGFVNKMSHTVPQRVEFRNQLCNTSSEVRMVLIFLSRLEVNDGQCHLTPPCEMHIAKVPPNVQARLIDEKQMPEIRSVCPQTILPRSRTWSTRGDTKTERELKRFFDTDLPSGSDGIWQPYALQVQVKDIAGPMDDVIVLQTDTAEVRIPITVSVLPTLVVQPKEIALLATPNAVASIDLRNTAKGPLEVRSLGSDNPLLDLHAERLSPSEVRVLVRWSGGQPQASPVHAMIQIKTSIGDTDIPYVLLASGGTS